MSEITRSTLTAAESSRIRAKEERTKNRKQLLQDTRDIISIHGDFMLDTEPNQDIRFTDPVGVMLSGESMVKMDLEQVTKTQKGESYVTETTTTINATIPHSRKRVPIFSIIEYHDSPNVFLPPTNSGIKLLNEEGEVASNSEVAEAVECVQSMKEKLDDNRRF